MRKLILDQIPYDEVKDVVRHLLRKGIDADSLVEEAAALLDNLVDWEKILGPKVGAAIDAIDRPLVVAVAKAIIASVRKEG